MASEIYLGLMPLKAIWLTKLASMYNIYNGENGMKYRRRKSNIVSSAA
jgi:hypothetical protein